MTIVSSFNLHCIYVTSRCNVVQCIFVLNSARSLTLRNLTKIHKTLFYFIILFKIFFPIACLFNLFFSEKSSSMTADIVYEFSFDVEKHIDSAMSEFLEGFTDIPQITTQLRSIESQYFCSQNGLGFFSVGGNLSLINLCVIICIAVQLYYEIL